MLKVILTIMTFLFLGAAYDTSAGGYTEASRASLDARIAKASVLPAEQAGSPRAILRPIRATVAANPASLPFAARKPLPLRGANVVAVRYAGKQSIGYVVSASGMVPLSAKVLAKFP